jgi:4-amino-4-deoxy-L-arabinose transferase-like glycosyltransferase
MALVSRLLNPLRDDNLAVSPRLMWSIFWAAAGSYIPMLFLHYVGEEPIYPIVAQEMWARHEYVVATLYGRNFGRPGLYAWLIGGLSSAIGWDHVLIAARLITIASTILMGLTLAWLVRRIFKDQFFAAFTAAVFLSGDVLLYRGWLAYADPFFSLLVFAAMAFLWVAVEERRAEFLLLAALALVGSFLAKAVTGFAFYGAVGLVLLWRHPNRWFLFHPWSFVVHGAALASPFIWNFWIAHQAVFDEMSRQTLYYFTEHRPTLLVYLMGLLRYPIRTFWYLLPISGVVVHCLVRRKFPPRSLFDGPIAIAIWSLIINLLPYLAAPEGSTRYLMPLYPLFALVMAYIVIRSGEAMARLSARLLMAVAAVAYISALVGFPLYEHYIRGSYSATAKTILAQAKGQPLYTIDDGALGLSVAANINTLRAPEPPITRPPATFDSGFVLANAPDPKLGRVHQAIGVGLNRDGRRTIYMLCRGAACRQSR